MTRGPMSEAERIKRIIHTTVGLLGFNILATLVILARLFGLI